LKMRNLIVLLLVLAVADYINCGAFKMCNNGPVLDAPAVKDQTVVNYILKKKVKHSKELGYERFQAINTESNESVVAKLYLRTKPDMTKSDPLLQYFWTYKDEPTDPKKECSQLDYIGKIAKT